MDGQTQPQSIEELFKSLSGGQAGPGVDRGAQALADMLAPQPEDKGMKSLLGMLGEQPAVQPAVPPMPAAPPAAPAAPMTREQQRALAKERSKKPWATGRLGMIPSQSQIQEILYRTGRGPESLYDEAKRAHEESVRKWDTMIRAPLGEKLEAVGGTVAGFLQFPIGVAAVGGKAIYNLINEKNPQFADAYQWGMQKADELFEWSKPRTEGGKLISETLNAPLAFVGEVIHYPGKLLWPNDPDAQAAWNLASDIALLAYGRAKAKGKTAPEIVKGKEIRIHRVDLESYRRFAKWYKDRSQSETPPTAEEVKQAAAGSGVPVQTIADAETLAKGVDEYMARNAEAAVETPEGRVAEGLVVPAPPRATTVTTPDGTTVTVTPPKRKPGVDYGREGAEVYREWEKGEREKEIRVEAARKAAPPKMRAVAPPPPAAEFERPLPITEEAPTTKAAAKAATFSRNEASEILRQVVEASGRDGLQRLAIAFNIPIAGKLPREVTAAIVPELMKIKKSRSAIQRVIDRAKAPAPPAPPAPTAPARTVPAEPEWPKETFEFIEEEPPESVTGPKLSLEEIRAEMKRREARAREEEELTGREIEKAQREPEPPEASIERPAPDVVTDWRAWEAKGPVRESFRKKPFTAANIEAFLIEHNGLSKERAKRAAPRVKRATRGWVDWWSDLAPEREAPPAYERAGIEAAPARPAAPRPAPAPPTTRTAPEKPARGAPRAKIEQIRADQEANFRKFRPEPRDPAARRSWQADLDDFVEATTKARLKKEGFKYLASGFDPTQFESLRVRFGKEAEQLIELMKMYNAAYDKYKTTRDTPGDIGHIEAMDAMPKIDTAIRRIWGKLTDEAGVIKTVLRQREEEGRQADERLDAVKSRIEELTDESERIGGLAPLRDKEGNIRKVPTWRLAGPAEFQAAKEAGIEVSKPLTMSELQKAVERGELSAEDLEAVGPGESGRYGGYVRSEAVEARQLPGASPEDAARLADIHRELFGLAREARQLEDKLGESDPVMTLEVGPKVKRYKQEEIPKVLEPGRVGREEEYLRRAYEGKWTEEDWLEEAAQRIRKQEVGPEAEITTAGRLKNQAIFSALSQVAENFKQARSRKRKLTIGQILKPLDGKNTEGIVDRAALSDALSKRDVPRFLAEMRKARQAMAEREIEEGAPYRRPPSIPAPEPSRVPTKGKATIIPPGKGGKLIDKYKKEIPVERPPEEETPQAQYFPPGEKIPKRQGQGQITRPDLRAKGVGITSPSIQTKFTELFPEVSDELGPETRAKLSGLQDAVIKAIDDVISEGVRSRLKGEKLYLETEEGVGGGTRAGMRYGGMTVEDVARSHKADIWSRMIQNLAEDPNKGKSQLYDLSERVSDALEKLRKDGVTDPEKRQATIMAAVHDSPLAKRFFSYVENPRGPLQKPLRERLPSMKATDLPTDEQLFRAVLDNMDDLEGEAFREAVRKQAGEFGVEYTKDDWAPLGHTALEVLAKSIDKLVDEFEPRSPIKREAIRTKLIDGKSAGVVFDELEAKYGKGAPGMPSHSQKINTWIAEYYKYLHDRAEEWLPETAREMKRQLEPITVQQALEGGKVYGTGRIIEHYLGRVMRAIRWAKGEETRVDALRRRMAEALEEKAKPPRPEKPVAEMTPEELAKKAKADEAMWPEEALGELERAEEEAKGGKKLYSGLPWDPETLRKVEDVVTRWFEKRRAKRVVEAAEKLRRSGAYQSESPEIQARWVASTIAKAGKGPVERLLFDKLRSVRDMFVRTYKFLPTGAKFARAIDALQQHEANFYRAINDAIDLTDGNMLKEIDGVTAARQKIKLYDTFFKRVFLDDLMEDLGRGNKKFPGGYTEESLQRDSAGLDAFIENLPENQKQLIKSTIEARKNIFKMVTDELVAEGRKQGYNFEKLFRRQNYYRHEVLEYYQGRRGRGQQMRPSTYSWGMPRKKGGWSGDIATDVRMVDTHILADLLYETYRLKASKAIKDAYDIYDATEASLAARGMTMREAMETGELPEGYRLYYPNERHLVYPGMTITERIALKILNGEELTSPQVKSIRKQMSLEEGGEGKTKLIIGPKRKPWLIPDELASQLEHLSKNPYQPGWLVEKALQTTGAWKAYKLLGPKRIVKFNVRNMTGDLEFHMIFNPDVRNHMKESYGYLKKMYQENKVDPAIKYVYDRGVMTSSYHWAELSSFARIIKLGEALEKGDFFDESFATKFKKAWRFYGEKSRGVSDLREAWLRIASFLSYKKQILRNMERGKGMVPDNYGASNREFIDALPDVDAKAWNLSNEVSGAYTMVSPAGKMLRQFPIPFWSWKEITVKRYLRGMKNAYIDGKTAREIGQALLRGSPYAFASKGYTALRIGSFVLKCNALMAILTAANRLIPSASGDPEAEEKLPRTVQEKPHITFTNGTYFSQIGATSDVLDFFGADQPPEMVYDWLTGNGTPEETAKKFIKGFYRSAKNAIFQSINPFVKGGLDYIMGKKTYPDFFNPRGIRDMGEYLADQLDMGDEYRFLRNRPGAPKNLWEYTQKLFLYKHEENETAYHETLTMKNEWKKARGSGESTGFGYDISKKGNELYYMKRAMAEGDTKSAGVHFKRYMTFAAMEMNLEGRSPEEITRNIVQGVNKSVMNMYPLSGLTLFEQVEFIRSLNDEKKKMLARAMKYWVDIMAGGEDNAKYLIYEKEQEDKANDTR